MDPHEPGRVESFFQLGQRLLLEQAQLAGLHGDVVILRFNVVDPADRNDSRGLSANDRLCPVNDHLGWGIGAHCR